MCLYNAQLKESFIEQYNENTQKMYKYVLCKTAETEELLDKDLCLFSYNELDQLFMGLEATSLPSVYTHVCIIKRYIDYCLIQGDIVPSGINYASRFLGDDLKRYISVSAITQKYITYNDLMNINNLTVNAQDVIPFFLLFYGVKGEKFEEIVNLKITDCDRENGNLTLTRNNGEQRIINVPDLVFEIIQEAVNQTEYQKSNGEMEEKHAELYINNKSMAPPIATIYPTKYVVRTIGRKKLSGVSPIIINSRVAKVSHWNGYDYLNPTNVWLSGMIHFTKEYVKENNLEELTVDDWEMINKRFGYSKNSRQYASVTKNKIEEYVWSN